MEEIETIYDFGLASSNESKILAFLDNIYKIPFESKQWETLLFDFFSKEIIVPYVVQTSIKIEKSDEMIEDIKQIFFKNIIYHNTIIFSMVNLHIYLC